MSWVSADWKVEILFRDVSMVGSKAQKYFKKVPMIDFARFVPVELSFGVLLC